MSNQTLKIIGNHNVQQNLNGHSQIADVIHNNYYIIQQVHPPAQTYCRREQRILDRFRTMNEQAKRAMEVVASTWGEISENAR